MAAKRAIGRVLGLDLGSKRIGVAISNSERTVATPIDTVHRTGDRPRDHRQINELVSEWEAEVIVVGLPLSLDGSVGPAAQGVLDEIDQLGATIPVPIKTYDERFTTVTADRSLKEQNLGAAERRKVVDMVAAQILLQGWLDLHREDPDV